MSQHTVQQLNIRVLNQDELADAVAICAQAMCDNPLHIKVFGQSEKKRQRRLRRFFLGMLAFVERKGWLYGAFVEQRLVGVLGVFAPNHCTPSIIDAMRLIRYLLFSNSLFGLLRMAIWLGSWAKLSPVPIGIGPLAVDRAGRVRHWPKAIGTQLNRPTMQGKCTPLLKPIN